MITNDEENYLKKIPAFKKVDIKAFDPKAKAVGKSIVAKVKKALPESKVLFMGATAFEIAGQNDIDIYLLSNPKDFNKYLSSLKKLFGKPKNTHKNFIEWNFIRNNHPVELYLTNPDFPSMLRQIKVFKILKSNKKLLKNYEDLKLKFNGKSFRNYQKAKYEFYNKILKKRNKLDA